MLDIAKTKLSGNDIRYFTLSSEQLKFEDAFDVVTAIQCHHYLDLEGRENAVRAFHKALQQDSGMSVSRLLHAWLKM